MILSCGFSSPDSQKTLDFELMMCIVVVGAVHQWKEAFFEQGKMGVRLSRNTISPVICVSLLLGVTVPAKAFAGQPEFVGTQVHQAAEHWIGNSRS
jgi:hypothetical protein